MDKKELNTEKMSFVSLNGSSMDKIRGGNTVTINAPLGVSAANSVVAGTSAVVSVFPLTSLSASVTADPCCHCDRAGSGKTGQCGGLY